jgi:hypothetical protein
VESKALDPVGALRAFRSARVIGALLMLCAIAIVAVFPVAAGPLPRGFGSPILAFELAATSAEVETMFGEPGSAQRAELMRAMDRGNQLDYLFLLLYASLLCAVALGFARHTGSRSLLVSVVLAPLSAAADAVENLQLLAITRSLGGDYSTAIERLNVWTRIKWGCLAWALAWLAPTLFRGDRVERVVAVVCALTGLSALGAAYQRAYFMELFALCVMLAFLGLVIVAWRRARTRPQR